MMAISLWQPWAQLCVLGEKRVETRSWPTNVRGRIAIHAAKKPLELTMELLPSHGVQLEVGRLLYRHGLSSCQRNAKVPNGLALGAIVGTVDIVDCVPIEQLYGSEYDTEKERAFGDWSAGRYGWIQANPVLFAQPVPERGHQGFWNWEGESHG